MDTYYENKPCTISHVCKFYKPNDDIDDDNFSEDLLERIHLSIKVLIEDGMKPFKIYMSEETMKNLVYSITGAENFDFMLELNTPYGIIVMATRKDISDNNFIIVGIPSKEKSWLLEER